MKQWEDKIVELAEALDSYIPEPERAIDGAAVPTSN